MIERASYQPQTEAELLIATSELGIAEKATLFAKGAPVLLGSLVELQRVFKAAVQQEELVIEVEDAAA